MNAPAPPEFEYTFTLQADGIATLANGGENLWASDGDDDFAEEFGTDAIVSAEIEDVVGWLVEQGYIPDGVEIDLVDESTEATAENEWLGGADGDDTPPGTE